MGATNHDPSPHRYQRIKNKSGIKMYRCAKDGCTTLIHYELIQGRTAECWRCRQPFTITRRTLRNKFLHCVACTSTKHGAKTDSVDKLIDSIFMNDAAPSEFNGSESEGGFAQQVDKNRTRVN